MPAGAIRSGRSRSGAPLRGAGRGAAGPIDSAPVEAPLPLRAAGAALAANPLRTGLALTGLVIGVASVLTMAALGAGARAAVRDDVRSAGTNLIAVRAGNYIRGGDAVNIPSGFGRADTLTVADAEAIAGIARVAAVSPVVESRAGLRSPLGDTFAPVHGVAETAAGIWQLSVVEGENFDAGQVAAGAAVALLSAPAAADLFPGRSAVGRRFSLHGREFEVLGVYRSSDRRLAEAALIPWPLALEAAGRDWLQAVVISTERAGDASVVARAVTDLLRERHRLTRAAPPAESDAPHAFRRGVRLPDDFTVRTQATSALTQGLYTTAAAFVLASMPRLDEMTSEEMVGTLSRATSTMTLLLGALAGVSLVVGGVGIMNVMLLAVTERTREIGLRLAVGARRREVLWQFLTEAVALSVLGGLLGIGLGALGAAVVEEALGWRTVIPAAAPLGAALLAGGVGVFFGWFPARRASRLDPIVALRSE